MPSLNQVVPHLSDGFTCPHFFSGFSFQKCVCCMGVKVRVSCVSNVSVNVSVAPFVCVCVSKHELRMQEAM